MVKGFEVFTSPNFTGANLNFVALVNQIILIIIVGMVLFFLIKYVQHRREVKIYEKVRGGYVVTLSRYTIMFDKENKLEYLKPIFGKNRLPNYPNSCWQKVKGTPFIGIKRTLSIIKQNANSYKVLLPPSNSKMGEVRYYNTLSWVFIDQKRLFEQKLRRKNLVHFLSIAAPIVIIIACMGFFVFAMFTQGQLTLMAANRINEATQLIVDVYGR